MQKLLLIFLLVLSVTLGAAEIQEVQYSFDADESTAEVNTSVFMSCESTCTGLQWSLSNDSEVLFVRNSRGEMDYSIEGDSISIPGSRAGQRENETVKIGVRKHEEAEEIYQGLYQRSISIPSFTGADTTGFIHNENLISGRIDFGFDYSFSEDEMRFRGEGPTNVRVKFGEGQQTRYFEFFGSKTYDTESAYEIPIGVLGFQQRFGRFPVAVMTDSDYDRSVNEWSAGEYVGEGIKIRDPSSIEDSFIPVLAHEVVHGLNDRRLNWDQTRSSYFDEGVSKYVESLVRKKMYNEREIEKPTRELFGENVRYDPNPNDREYFNLPPKGDKEVLWNYYQNDREFMKTWSAFSSSDSDTRSFGYAYSELVIANYIARDEGSIRGLYRDLQVDRKISSNEEKWNILSKHLDMSPCNYSERERFENCIEEINNYDYPVYSAKPQQNQAGSIQIDRLEIPNRTEPSNSFSGIQTGNLSSTGKDANQFFSGIMNYLSKVFKDIIAAI